MRILLLVALLPITVHAADLAGVIVGVHDGDTVTLLDAQRQQHKIRLAGIDAPELKQAFGQVSKRHLSAMVFDKDVTAECGKTDKYRREVCVVKVAGKDVNLAQVESGMAWWYRKYQNEQTPRQRADYEQAEVNAKAGRLGLWGDARPMPPWEWRKR